MHARTRRKALAATAAVGLTLLCTTQGSAWAGNGPGQNISLINISAAGA